MENIEYKFILDISCDFLSFIGFTVYLELIELNFCGLNYNLGRHISIRAYSEIYESTDTFIIDNEEEEDWININYNNLFIYVKVFIFVIL